MSHFSHLLTQEQPQIPMAGAIHHQQILTVMGRWIFLSVEPSRYLLDRFQTTYSPDFDYIMF